MAIETTCPHYRRPDRYRVVDQLDDTFGSVAAIGAAYRAGTIPPLQVVERALARAEALEPHLNAIIDPMREVALRVATAATREPWSE